MPPAIDYASYSFTVKGLSQAAENMMNLASGPLRTMIARGSSRAAAWTVGDAIKRATYTTFKQQTGWIKSGVGVRVAQGIKGTVLNAVVAELPQYGGALNPMASLFRSTHMPKLDARRASLAQVAFWWRFLEFGTRQRRAKKMPRFLRRASNKSLSTRQERSKARYFASPNRGGIAARPWVRPAFAASDRAAVDTYEATMRQLTETEVAKLPK